MFTLPLLTSVAHSVSNFSKHSLEAPLLIAQTEKQVFNFGWFVAER